MATNYPVYNSSEYILGPGTANHVLQEQGNEAVDPKIINTPTCFSCFYAWGFKNFLKYHIQDSENVKTAKVKIDSLVWELSVRFRKGSGRDDFTATITLVSVSGITPSVTINWKLQFVGKNSHRLLIKEDAIKDLKNPYRNTFAIGRNLFLGKSYEDLCSNEYLIITFELRSRYITKHQTTKIRNLDNELPNSPLCLSNLSSDLLNLMENCDMSDVILNVGASKFKAHKVILSARSKRFSSMFKNSMEEQRSITIVDVEAIDMHNLLVYIYSGAIAEMPVDTLMNLYSAAYKYQVSALVNRCRELIILRLNIDNIRSVRDFAMRYPDQELRSAVKSSLMFNTFAMLGLKN